MANLWDVTVGPAVGGVLQIFGAVVFAYVGRVVAQRKLDGEEANANHAFVLWWYGLAALGVSGGAFALGSVFGYTDLALYLTMLHAAIAVILLGLWGLTYYLAYLYTGNTRWRARIAYFYGAYYLFLEYLINWAEPVGVTPGRWQVNVDYVNDLSGIPFLSALILLIVVPPMLGAIGYMSLYRRATLAIQRYRILMIGAGVLFWFGTGLIASMTGLSQVEWWTLASRLVSLIGAGIILLAFKPPALVRRRLHAPGLPVAAEKPQTAALQERG